VSRVADINEALLSLFCRLSLSPSPHLTHLLYRTDTSIFDPLTLKTVRMLFSPVFLGFITSVSAIDVWLNWSATNCRGSNSLVCSGLGPNSCCTVRGGRYTFGSIDFRAIPSDWDLDLRGHDLYECGALKEVVRSGGKTGVCLSHGLFGGGGYGFRSRKRATGEEDCDPVAPSIVAFGDGSEFDLTQMDQESVLEILEIAGNDTTSSELPAKFTAYKLN
jgi:hypothetical protein